MIIRQPFDVSTAQLLAPTCCGVDLEPAKKPPEVGDERICAECGTRWAYAEKDLWVSLRARRRRA